MLSRSRCIAVAATALALCLAPAWGDSTPLEIPWGDLERPPAPFLPFRPEGPAFGHAPWTLHPRLAASLSLAAEVERRQDGEPAAASDEAESAEDPSAFRGELTLSGRDLLGGSQAWLDLSGFLRTGLGSAHMTRWPATDVRQGRAALDNARLALDAGVGPLGVYVSIEGSTDGGRQYLVHDGQGGELEVYDAYAELGLGPRIDLRLGRFRAPVSFSTLLDENELLFLDRTGIGQQWFERDDGVGLHARGDRLEGWLAVQDGADGGGDELAFTARGVLRLFGEGEAPRREGAFDADLGETVYLGVAWYEDRSLADSRVMVVEAAYTFEAFSLAGEALVPDDGFANGGDFWNLTASAMLVPERWEVAARYEDFRDRAGAQVWHAGVVRYLRGSDTKLQLGLARLEHPDEHLDVTSLDLTLVASF